jgi:hypothetical protein
MPVPVEFKIIGRHNRYHKEMNGIWHSFAFVRFYSPIVRRDIVARVLPPLKCDVVATGAEKQYAVADTLGIISNLDHVANTRRTLIDAVSTFEAFLGDLCQYVYEASPERLAPKANDKDSAEREDKLISTILSSKSREEIIEKLAEEKIRRLFYGNPLDFFRTEKASLGFKNKYTSSFPTALDCLAEIIARRNIFIHNGRRVDQKYLREVKSTTLQRDAAAMTSPGYLRLAIDLMSGFGASVTHHVISTHFHLNVTGSVAKHSKRFGRTWADTTSSNKIFEFKNSAALKGLKEK